MRWNRRENRGEGERVGGERGGAFLGVIVKT